MNTVYLVVRYEKDAEAIASIISAHPNRKAAINGERFYRSYEGIKFRGLVTDILEVVFEEE